MHEKTIVAAMVTLVSASGFLESCFTPHSGSDSIMGRNVRLAETVDMPFDSTLFAFNFYPERWNLTGDTLWTVNSRDSLFLVGYDISNKRDFCHWGLIGNGPEDYVSPGIMEGVVDHGVVLYGNTENKVVSYSLSNNRIAPLRWGSMPEWIHSRALPRPYTRVASINDSICVGTYFLPRRVGADIFNWHTGSLLSELNLSIQQPEDNMSGPYEFKIATTSNKIIVAYRYINRVEVYNLNSDNHAELQCVIGDKEDQNDLYVADRDDEMIKFYSDVQCDSSHIYLLFHGVAEKELVNSVTYLRVYDINLTENQQNVELKKFFSQFLVADGESVLLYSPISENHLFTITLCNKD